MSGVPQIAASVHASVKLAIGILFSRITKIEKQVAEVLASASAPAPTNTSTSAAPPPVARQEVSSDDLSEELSRRVWLIDYPETGLVTQMALVRAEKVVKEDASGIIVGVGVPGGVSSESFRVHHSKLAIANSSTADVVFPFTYNQETNTYALDPALVPAAPGVWEPVGDPIDLAGLSAVTIGPFEPGYRYDLSITGLQEPYNNTIAVSLGADGVYEYPPTVSNDRFSYLLGEVVAGELCSDPTLQNAAVWTANFSVGHITLGLNTGSGHTQELPLSEFVVVTVTVGAASPDSVLSVSFGFSPGETYSAWSQVSVSPGQYSISLRTPDDIGNGSVCYVSFANLQTASIDITGVSISVIVPDKIVDTEAQLVGLVVSTSSSLTPGNDLIEVPTIFSGLGFLPFPVGTLVASEGFQQSTVLTIDGNPPPSDIGHHIGTAGGPGNMYNEFSLRNGSNNDISIIADHLGSASVAPLLRVDTWAATNRYFDSMGHEEPRDCIMLFSVEAQFASGVVKISRMVE